MKFLNLYNFFVGSALAFAMDILNNYGIVLSSLLLLNSIDWITGTCKARLSKTESSMDGLKGILKKLGYWIIILVAFIIGYDLTIIGIELGFEFDLAIYLGWLTVGMLVINEARSILENLTELGIAVPIILIKGLAVYQNSLEDKFLSDDCSE